MVNASNLTLGNAKALNTVKILDLLRAQEGATVADISQITAIPLATVYRIIHTIMERGLIIQTQKVSSINGRQPIVYSINPSYAGAVCIIIEKLSISVCISGMNGRVFQMGKKELDSKWEKEDILECIHESILSLFHEHWKNAAFNEIIKVIHIAVEADVDREAGKILRCSGISCLDDFEIAAYFQSRYNIPTYLNKLLYVEAIASIQNYYRYSFENYIYLHIGVGFGATIVIDQKIYFGTNGKAGELVRLRTPEGLTWEEAYSTSNLYRRLLKAAADNPQSQLNAILMDSLTHSQAGTVPPLMKVLDRTLESECAEATDILADAVKGWTNAIHLLYTFFDPEVIVIGGDISVNTPNVFNEIRKELCRGSSFEGVVLPAEYETSLMDAVALGAMNMLYENVYEELSAILS